MKFCTKCGKELMDEAVVCTGCGCAVANAPQTIQTTVAASPEADEVNIGLCVLAAFIPLFGVIYWPLKHKETPKKAKACGITALVSWGVGILFSILWATAFSSIFSNILYNLY
jgi:uncharacterized membrane protein YvbJ